MDERLRLQELVTQNGAEYHGQLAKHVTHLVARRPEGEKYKHASLWGLNVVSVEWLTDSVERGMALYEPLYDPKLPAEERGKGARRWREASPGVLGKRLRQVEEPATAADTQAADRKKLRRTTSLKLESQNSALWGDIIGGDIDRRAADETLCEDSFQAAEPSRRTSRPGVGTPAPQDVGRPKTPDLLETAVDLGDGLHASKQGLFSNLAFYLHRFDNKKVLDILWGPVRSVANPATRHLFSRDISSRNEGRCARP